MPSTVRNWVAKNQDKVDSAHVEYDEWEPESPYSICQQDGSMSGQRHMLFMSRQLKRHLTKLGSTSSSASVRNV